MANLALVTDEFFQNNKIFDEADPIVNRDDCQRQWIELRAAARSKGHFVDTVDLNSQKADLFLFQNIPDPESPEFLRAKQSKKPLIAIINELPYIHPWNARKDLHEHFAVIFTYQDDLIDSHRYRKLNYSHHFPKEISGSFDRPIFCCMIAANKSLNHTNELYSERRRAIDWFGKNHPEEFHLYGRGWNLPAVNLDRPHSLTVLWRRFTKKLKPKFMPPSTYKGEVLNKKAILEKARFALCYENASDAPGWITEKIFDVLFAGCVPVYLGAPNIAQHIPETIFIDKRRFSDYGQLYRYLRTWQANEYETWLTSVNDFLGSQAVHEYTIEYFTQQLLRSIDELLTE